MLRDLPLRTTHPEACTVCGPCWARVGGNAAASEIGAPPELALPVRAPISQAEYTRLFEAEPWVQRLRRDTRQKLFDLVTALRNWADWETFECRPTWPRLCEASGWARSTMAGWLRQLWVTGWLARIEPGSTPAHRPMGSPSEAEGNRAAVYGLRIPASADAAAQRRERAEISRQAADVAAGFAQLSEAGGKTWTPSLFLDLDQLLIELNHLRTRASEIFHRFGDCPEVEKIEALRARFDRKKRAFQFSDLAPDSRAEMLVAAAELQHQHPVFGRMSPRAIRFACRLYWRSGWSNGDVLWAMRYQPTGWAALSEVAEYAVIHPAGWVRTRLAPWRRGDGRVLPGRGLMAADRAGNRLVRSFFREEYGAAGAKLVEQAGHLTWDLVAEHGRRCAERLAGEVRADAARRAAVAKVRAEAERRRTAKEDAIETTPLQRRLIDEAKRVIAPTATSAAPSGVAEPPVAGMEPVTGEERIARARAMAEAQRHGSGRFGTVRRRWR